MISQLINRAAYLRAYYLANQGRLRKYQKEYNLANQEKIITRQKAYGQKNKVKIAARNKDYREANKDAVAEGIKRWKSENPGRVALHIQNWVERNPQKNRAHRIVAKAVESGELTKNQSCVKCGDGPTDAHHEDYSKPLKVIWLCRQCHVDLHAAEKAEDLLALGRSLRPDLAYEFVENYNRYVLGVRYE